MGTKTEAYSEKQNRWPGRRSLALLSAAALLLQACALPLPHIEEKTKADFGRIGVVSASFAPEIEISAADPGSGAAVGAAVGWAAGGVVGTIVIVSALSSCLFAPPACPVMAPFVLGGAAAGGVTGAVVGSIGDGEANAALESAEPSIKIQVIQDALRARIMAYARRHGVGPLAVIDDPRPSEPGETPDYRQLSGKGVDTVLEVRLLALKLQATNFLAVKYQPHIVVRARVIRVGDHATILNDQVYGLSGTAAVPDIWGEDNGRRFRAWVKYAYATMAEYILDEMILLYTPFAVDTTFGGSPRDLPLRFSDEKGRGGLSGFGLRPEYPKLNSLDCSLGLCPPSPYHAFTKIDTLRPEFRWRPLGRAEQSADDKASQKIHDVKYEIRLFTARSKFAEEGWYQVSDGPVYSRSGLVEPGHRIEHPLAPCTKYFWTMRARFRIDGQPRVTEWANSHGSLWELRRTTSFRLSFPTDWYFPFQTHCPGPASAGTNQ